ncbi:Hypothetical predicted protein [Mytilus galloprovincialis]|uniref:Uncharacterized protein n=1 Tax=Mytilus galloprovincialis TaxID=29158 RepID=A0A8B6EG74_MYTGA|nr:Hypothetical predicted protein [Mytilus galloprovincialis]
MSGMSIFTLIFPANLMTFTDRRHDDKCKHCIISRSWTRDPDLHIKQFLRYHE